LISLFVLLPAFHQCRTAFWSLITCVVYIKFSSC
jgi:hypothetical protein